MHSLRCQECAPLLTTCVLAHHAFPGRGLSKWGNAAAACQHTQLTSCPACTSSPPGCVCHPPRCRWQPRALHDRRAVARPQPCWPSASGYYPARHPCLPSALAQALRPRPACGSRRPPRRALPARRLRPPPTSTRAPPEQTAGRRPALPYPCAARPAAAPAGPRARAPAEQGPAGPPATPAAPTIARALSTRSQNRGIRSSSPVMSGNPGRQQRRQVSQRLLLSAHGMCRGKAACAVSAPRTLVRQSRMHIHSTPGTVLSRWLGACAHLVGGQAVQARHLAQRLLRLGLRVAGLHIRAERQAALHTACLHGLRGGPVGRRLAPV